MRPILTVLTLFALLLLAAPARACAPGGAVITSSFRSSYGANFVPGDLALDPYAGGCATGNATFVQRSFFSTRGGFYGGATLLPGAGFGGFNVNVLGGGGRFRQRTVTRGHF